MMTVMQQHSHSFLVLLLMVFIAGIVLSGPSTPRRSRVRRQNMKVRINATGDTIVMKFLRPNADTKLEGYILGYGSSMFSKQFIQLPENGQMYETEFDAEPKYLIAVQPIPTNEVKKQCTGKVQLEKPLHLVIGSVTPTSVLLSWGTLLKTPYEGNVMNDCLEDGHYTVRYREKNRKWNYQTCPTSDTVIDNLKPNTVYEFGVQPNSKDGTGLWSKPVIHNISTVGIVEKIFKRPVNPVKHLRTDPPFAPRHVPHNRTQGRLPLSRNIAPKTTLATTTPTTTTTRQEPLSTPGPTLPVVTKQPIGRGDLSRSVLPTSLEVPLAPKLHFPLHITATMASFPFPQTNVEKHGGHLSQPQQKPQSQPHAQPLPNPQLHPQYRPPPQLKPHTQKPQLKPHSKAKPQPIIQTQLQLQSTSQPTHHTQPTSLSISQTQPQHQPTSQFIPQTQPQHQSTSQPMFQTLPQPQRTPQFIPKILPQHQPISQSIPQTQPQPKPTSQPILQSLPQLQSQSTPQPKLKTQTQLQSQSKPHPQSQPQTTTQLQAEPKPQPTPQPNHQAHPQTKPHLSTHQAQLTLKHIPQTQQTLPKIHIQPQPQPQSPQIQTQSQTKTNPQSQPQIKTNPEPQLTTKQQSKAQPTTKPKTQPPLRPKKQSKPQPKYKPNYRRRDQQQPHPKLQPWPQSPPPTKTQAQSVPPSQPIPQPHPPLKAQTLSQLEPLPKPTLSSRPQPQPQPGHQFQSQTRTYTDPTKVTPRQAVPTAPSPPEEGKPLPRPALATEKAGSYNQGTDVLRPSVAEVPRSPISSSTPPAGRNGTLSRTRVPPHATHNSVRPFSPSKTFPSSHSSSTPGDDGAHHRGNAHPKSMEWSKDKPVLYDTVPAKRPNAVGKPHDHDKPIDRKQEDKESILRPFPLVTAKPKQERRQQTTTSAPALNSIISFSGSRFDLNENSSIFRPLPASEVDIMGKKRFVAPHVIYKTDKKPDEPCSITSSLAYFPDEEGSDQNVTGPPRIPPSNLTVVTVEGCPSFVILDWQKSDNETKEYEVVSTAKGPNGEEVSVLTTNQTHTAVENLKPESRYEFKVTPKNELGTGPSSDPVSFSTESADPRVSEHVSGKDAIWTQFPFKSDAYSECNGKQYVKRTWYRKFVGIQLCNSLRYKIYLSDSLTGKFYNIGDQTGHGEDHCQFVDSFLDGRTGTQMFADQLQSRLGFYRALRQEPVSFGEIGGKSHITYVGWYECGTPIPGKW
ncbi:target of Nesh-SH3 isoform X1 [Micropterus salmoides]|uniref:target of Nesh-SH3 isoform X1 n=1 Tax=Micropterus salmoides TaxID=27706 RepID=UPI0018ED041B|nr:target of Nesh-SH3 isoform X1 [Micropterus salmoides]XP_038576831.1 target of Nesh-SH3 isoform X1 [Micropterus salmoides]XP_038576832.1 target of Nesh-SH3 isoform X1 [Micropterus salmoides]XP_038576833.1 target of Nesh-SH3 isoform X1 [Micropterus salmoides]